MNTKKEINLQIKESTLQIIGKYLSITFCCFLIAAIYPFVNIYFGKYSVNVIDYNAFITLRPYIEKEWITLYNGVFYEKSEYEDISIVARLNDINSKLGFSNAPESRKERIIENLKKNTSVFTSIKMIFGIKHYANIFYWIFFPLLIITVLLMNFKFNFKLKDDEYND